MTCHGLKGGIGSASRLISLPEGCFTLGVLVLANHGKLADLLLEGKNIGREIDSENLEPDKGSIIVLLATDLPASDRQLRRILEQRGLLSEKGNASCEILSSGGSSSIALMHKILGA